MSLCVIMYLLRICSAQSQHNIHLRDVTRWKSITQTIINTATALHCGELFVLFGAIHKMAQLTANSRFLHLSFTDHFACEWAVIDCVYASSPPRGWWSEMCEPVCVMSLCACHCPRTHTEWAVQVSLLRQVRFEKHVFEKYCKVEVVQRNKLNLLHWTPLPHISYSNTGSGWSIKDYVNVPECLNMNCTFYF